ncbi:MAG: aminotransferase class I/II-fold pyridoxal phosphate-dependent enzyme, partial [Myxococcota bacterium]|nr:aminotransferase class I/II-fold pyridoxal phosphate-dependent enzyme [Myxococcota bacterium]
SETKVFKHRDMNHLESLLKAESRSRKIVVTDEVFSMDGVRAPLVELAALKAKYPFILVTDSAHSTGIYGDFGSGLVNAAGVTDDVDFQVGTLSKALASHGGFVSCSERNRAWLLNSARAFIFSTALPVPNVVAATAAIEIMGNDEDVRARLWNRITELAKLMRQAPTGPIFPVIVGDEATVLKQAASLYAKGFHVPAIRPPTVPEGTCRLRITLSAAHQRSEINALYKAMVANPS